MNLKIHQILIVAVVFLLAYFLFFYNFFQIKKLVFIDYMIVQDTRMDNVIKSILSQRRYFVFPGSNIFLVNKESIEGALLEQVPELDSLEIIKKYPDILKIKVKEAEPKALWVSDNEEYIIDGGGVVRGRVSDIGNYDTQNLIRIVDQNNKEVKIKENVVYAKHLNFIKILYDLVPQSGISIKEMILPSALAEEVHMMTEEGWRVFFILDKDLEQQVNNMNLILEKEVDGKMSREDLDYIDLRVENWAYYKKKSLEQKQQIINTEENPEGEEITEDSGEEIEDGQ